MAARDLLLIPILIFAVAMGLLILNKTTHTMSEAMQANDIVNDSQAAMDAFDDTVAASDAAGDKIVVGLFIGLLLAVIITGWFIGGHPVFVVFYFIAMVIGTIVSAFLANTWEAVSGLAVFGAQVSNFGIANHIILYMPMYVVAIGFIGAIAIYARTRVDGGAI